MRIREVSFSRASSDTVLSSARHDWCQSRACPIIRLRRGVEAIADPRLGREMSRRGRIGFQLLSKLSDEHAQVFGMLSRRFAPDRLEQPLVLDDAIGPPREVHEQIEFLRRE